MYYTWAVITMWDATKNECHRRHYCISFMMCFSSRIQIWNALMNFNVLPLVPIKTLQSLSLKFLVVYESFETNLRWTIITMDQSFVTVCSTWIDNPEQKLCIIENVGVKYHGPLSVGSAEIYWLRILNFECKNCKVFIGTSCIVILILPKIVNLKHYLSDRNWP